MGQLGREGGGLLKKEQGNKKLDWNFSPSNSMNTLRTRKNQMKDKIKSKPRNLYKKKNEKKRYG